MHTQVNKSEFDRNKTTIMQQYIKSLHAPFNSVSPRFNYAKDSASRMENPGPGSYILLSQTTKNLSTLFLYINIHR